MPDEVRMHMVQSMKEMSLSALDSTHKEQVAFCQVMLTDLDKQRVRQAHDIRMPVKASVTDAQANLNATIEEFTNVEQKFAKRLSEFLGSIAESLN